MHALLLIRPSSRVISRLVSSLLASSLILSHLSSCLVSRLVSSRLLPYLSSLTSSCLLSHLSSLFSHLVSYLLISRLSSRLVSSLVSLLVSHLSSLVCVAERVSAEARPQVARAQVVDSGRHPAVPAARRLTRHDARDTGECGGHRGHGGSQGVDSGRQPAVHGDSLVMMPATWGVGVTVLHKGGQGGAQGGHSGEWAVLP